MRLRLTIILVLLNLIAFGVIFYKEYSRTSLQSEETAQPIFPSAIRGSDRIEISGDAIPAKRVLQKTGSVWKLEEPVVWPANPNAVERIFQSLLFLRRDIHFTVAEIRRNNQDLSDYGLEQPDLTITLHREGKSTVIHVGSPTDVGNRYYLLGPSGQDIYVVDEEMIRAVALDIQDLQSSRLFDQNFFDVSEISLQPDSSRNLRIRLTSTEDGWMFESPIQTRANAPAVDSRLQALTETHITSLTKEDRLTPVVSGLASPRMRLSLEGAGKRQTFLLGNKKEGEKGISYGQIEGTPTIVTVPEKPFLAFSQAQTELRERNFLNFRVPSLTNLIIEGTDQRKITLQKLEDETWRVLTTNEAGEQMRYPADTEILAQTITNLLTLRASRFVTDAPSESDLESYGLSHPQRRVRIESEKTQELLIGDIDPERMTLYAKIASEPFVYTIPVQIIRDLPLSPLAYRSRIMQIVPETGTVRSIRVVRLPDEEILLERELSEDGLSWEESLEEVDPEEQIAFIELIRQIKRFRVTSYLSGTFSEDGLPIEDDRVLPWAYRWEADIELPGGNGVTRKTRSYYLTERVEGTLQGGGSPAFSSLFTLPQSFIDAWHVLFFDRPLPLEYDESVLKRFQDDGPPDDEINDESVLEEPIPENAQEPEPVTES